MPDHRFRLGQIVMLVGRTHNVPPGPYEIVRQLPSETADLKYRIKSRDETHERVVSEHELRPAGEGER
jgi:hypothetical protein